jgi:hypothetical protein
MNMLEDRLDSAAQDVRRGLDRIETRSADFVIARHRRRKATGLAVAGGLAIGALLVAGALTRETPSGVAAQTSAVLTVPSPPATTTTVAMDAESYAPTPPEDDQWVQLDQNLWYALVPESDESGTVHRVWTKSDVERPEPSPATNIRNAFVRVGESALYVIVFETPGHPLPVALTLTWTDGGSETVDLVPSETLGLGIARFAYVDEAQVFDLVDVP